MSVTFFESSNQHYTPVARMFWEENTSPGYHTQIPNGVKVHSTRTTLHTALKLLEEGGGPAEIRAAQATEAVLALQDIDPTSKTYGIWPWFLEEPLAQMAPPDWNWADFCGAALGQILVRHENQLSAALRSQIRTALGHAAWSIFRRNVGPDYTNVAIMGAGVCAVAGEVLEEVRLLAYARQRLARLVEHTCGNGDFAEYNSPTYTPVALSECERILLLVHDAATRQSAETLRRFAWTCIATRFHPPTRQWAGPHARAYADTLKERALHFLAARTGVDFSSPDLTRTAPTHAFPCPSELIERFRVIPDGETQVRCRLIAHPNEADSVYGTTWMNEWAALGSVSRDTLWTQRRPLIAYWKVGEAVAVLRARFLKDGRDFASAEVRNDQCGSRVVSAFGFSPGQGEFHPNLDRPPNGVFEAGDFRIRYELSAPGAHAKQIAPDRFHLSAGEGCAALSVSEGAFLGESLHWELGVDDERVWLDGVCFSGENREFDLTKIGDWAQKVELEMHPSLH